MNRHICPACTAFAVALAFAALGSSAHAQIRPGFIRLIRPYHQVVLVQLPEVEKALALKEEQKTKALDLYEELNSERFALYQEAQGDFESIRPDVVKVNDDIAKQFNDALDETQKKRLAELYAQVNGPVVLVDANIGAELKLSDDQKAKLDKVRIDSSSVFRGDIDWQSLDDEEFEKKVEEVIASQNEAYSAVLTDEQKAAFVKMQGEKLEVDLANLPNPFGG